MKAKRFLAMLLTGCLAVLTLFSFVGCGEKYKEDFITFKTWNFTSGVPNNLIILEIGEEKASFECTVSDGYFWWDNAYEQNVTVPEKTTLGWVESGMESDRKNSYIDIIVYVEQKIIGCAVIAITYDGEIEWYQPKLVKTKIFKNTVSYEEVKKVLEENKKQ